MSNLQVDHDRASIEAVVEDVFKKTSEVKRMIEELLETLEMDSSAPWPVMLEKVAACVSNMTQLESTLKRVGPSEPAAILRQHLFVPQMLSMDVDQRLLDATQGRIASFHHDLVPDYLRTKPDKEMENEEININRECLGKTPDIVHKQINGMNKQIEHIISQTSSERDKAEPQQNKPQTYDTKETERLVKAIFSGIGLRPQQSATAPPTTAPTSQAAPSSSSHAPQQPGVPGQMPPMSVGMAVQPGVHPQMGGGMFHSSSSGNIAGAPGNSASAAHMMQLQQQQRAAAMAAAAAQQGQAGQGMMGQRMGMYRKPSHTTGKHKNGKIASEGTTSVSKTTAPPTSTTTSTPTVVLSPDGTQNVNAPSSPTPSNGCYAPPTTPRSVSRNRPSSSRCDFVGHEPSPSPMPESRRPSQVDSELQAIWTNWLERPRTWHYPTGAVTAAGAPEMTTTTPPHMLLADGKSMASVVHIPDMRQKTSSSSTSSSSSPPNTERLTFFIVFPWMVACVNAQIVSTLAHVKRHLFPALKNMAVPGFPMNERNYIFASHTYDYNEVEDLFDEDQTVQSLFQRTMRQFHLLFLRVPEGHTKDQEVSSLIGHAIGRHMVHLEPMLTSELKRARVDLYYDAEKAVNSRGKVGYEHYAFPEERRGVFDTLKMDATTQRDEDAFNEKMTKAKRQYHLYFRELEAEENDEDIVFCEVFVEFHPLYTPHVCIVKGLEKLREEDKRLESMDAKDFLLQMVAQKRFLTGEQQRLTSYAGVRAQLEDFRDPAFVVRRRSIVMRDYPEPLPLYKPTYVRVFESRKAQGESQDPNISLWKNDEFLCIKPTSVANLGSCDPDSYVYVAMMVTAGPIVLAKCVSTLVSVYNPRWEQEKPLNFDLYLKDLPECAVLHISLVEAKESKTVRKLREKRRRESLNPRTHDRGRGRSAKKDTIAEVDETLENPPPPPPPPPPPRNPWEPYCEGVVEGDDVQEIEVVGPDPVPPPIIETDEERLDRQREETLRRVAGELQKEWLEITDTFDISPVGWLNVPIFDWKQHMIKGVINASLRSGCGPGACEANHYLAVDGTLSYYDHMHACRLQYELPFRRENILPPTKYQYKRFIMNRMRYVPGTHPMRLLEKGEERDDPVIVDPKSKEGREYFARIDEIDRRYQLGTPMTPQEQLFIWEQRFNIREYRPDALILLVDNAVTWKRRDEFGELYCMLDAWNLADVGRAFTMLDKKFTFAIIRAYVVNQLSSILDSSTFPLYILPLIQALKCERFAMNCMVRLLLNRAIVDFKIGQKLFWLLRSELDNLQGREQLGMYCRISLLMEAFLRGNPNHLPLIVRQVEMVDRLTRLSVMVKQYSERNTATKKLQEELKEQQAALEKIDSPLDPTNELGELVLDKCKVLGSAKLPLRLRWKNRSPMGAKYHPHYEIIFKNGDDLRQDMLVLQMLEVMDSIWKKAKMDCFLCIYPVLPMGTMIGMIGVVPDCMTIFEIQNLDTGKVGTAVSAFDTSSVNRYLRANFPAAKDYLECVDRFAMSCVAYSVATYIMGIKDRHNDNIMMTREGRLFHIDFGHILGHGKKKLGVERDRTPFVLTDHLLCVIEKGGRARKGDNNYDRDKFRNLTVKAYALLWDCRQLFISLFSIMKGMRLPELSTEADLQYLRESLAINVADRSEAEKFFTEIFRQAESQSWSTKTNWFFHSVKHM